MQGLVLNAETLAQQTPLDRLDPNRLQGKPNPSTLNPTPPPQQKKQKLTQLFLRTADCHEPQVRGRGVPGEASVPGPAAEGHDSLRFRA